MKKLLLLFLSFTAVFVAKADDQVLRIWQADGQVQTIKLDEQPVTKYVDGNLVITTTRTTITYPLDKVRKYTYGSVTDGITIPQVMNAAFSKDGETLTFTNLKPQTGIALYNVSGQLLRQESAPQNGKAVISVSNLPVGVYVVKVNGATYKISKR